MAFHDERCNHLFTRQLRYSAIGAEANSAGVGPGLIQDRVETMSPLGNSLKTSPSHAAALCRSLPVLINTMLT